MGVQGKKWMYLLVLTLIWGSSFILIKKGLVGLSAIQVGALRIVFTAFFLFSVGFKRMGEIKKQHWKWIALSGFLSSFFPPFFFAMAQTQVDSGVASVLNSLTPLNTLLAGTLFFGITTSRKQAYGVVIGFVGTLILILKGAEFNPDQNYWYSILIILSTLGYALNVNIIKKHLTDISALAVTTGNFVFIVLPAFIILWATGFFETVMASKEMQLSVLYVTILSLFGTAFAKVLFNKLIQIASPVFASSVTYTMPLLAILWGVLDGESFSFLQLMGGCIILVGVYLANNRKK
ncbi:EamA domain-containing membrane protein RarD [Zhouia amylolytica]|uniref:EamA domain-containing membrane protein RarD n=2 Tax=Zhouia amylolytica TaxID=376730 RepID=A0A1I6SIK3_9FLAO|nr:EamA family transporter [Zhouia amylolytica]ETN94625.1 putative permease [Zhouia amylolytica AD3]MCQ0111624.1 EamA family transporter [Zhouia amylolytica]SFS76777.1 EamA domain-containing membrane protein RarD [Zhouia amylolytica]